MAAKPETVRKFLNNRRIVLEIQSQATLEDALIVGGKLQARMSSAGRDNDLRTAKLSQEFELIWNNRAN